MIGNLSPYDIYSDRAVQYSLEEMRSLVKGEL